jgi:hypothetical protein
MKQVNIVCPRSTEPQILKNVEERYVAYKNDLTKCGDKPKSKGKRTIEYKDLNKRSKKKMRETVLAIDASTAPSVLTVSVSTARFGPAIFMLHVPMFNMTPPA